MNSTVVPQSNIFYLNGAGKVDFKREQRVGRKEVLRQTRRLADVEDP